jgi:glycosyltransferase involved in cell wall biosynthesis
MHVLYLIDSLAPGGAERSLAAMAPYLVAGGLRLEVATFHERPGVQAELAAAGVRLHGLGGPGGRVSWVRQAARLLRDRRPELVHTTLFEADVVGRVAASRCHVPVVSSLVNVAYGAEQQAGEVGRLKLRAAQLVDGITARRVVRFHAISAHVADLMGRRLHLRRDRIEVIPRGRDAGRLGVRDPTRRDKARALLGIGQSTPLVVAAARHEHQKGLDVLLAAFSGVLEGAPAARLAIAGRTGNQSSLLRSVVSSLRLDGVVQLLGAREDVPELLCAADVFVVPSRWEGLGSVLLEAMALKAPIVASDLPAVRELVDHGTTALLVPAGQPEPLADAIVAALSDRAGAARRARSARERFLADFAVDRIADRMLAFYDHALSATRS